MMFKIFLSVMLAMQNVWAVSNPPTAIERQYLSFTNYLTNPGFESGKRGWSSTTTDFTITTTSTEVFDGDRAAEWNPNSAQSLRSSSWTPRTNAPGNGVGFCRVRTNADADYDFEIFDGTNVIAEVDIPASTEYQLVYANFPIVGGTSYSVQVSSAGDDDEIQVDGCGIGYAEGWNIADVSQAEFVGSITYAGATNCNWTRTGVGSDSFADFGADTDCPAPTVVGSASAPSTRIPAIVFANLPPGEYRFEASGTFVKGGAQDNVVNYRFSDGTNTSEVTGVYSAGAVGSGSTIAGRILRSSSGTNVTINLQGLTANTSNTVNIQNNTTSSNFSIKVYRYPLASQIAVKADTTRWLLDLNISGANISLGTSNQAAYITPNNASLTMTVNTSKGSAPAGISCSSTNDNTVGATTCSSGNEEPGFVANFPRAGLVEVCFQFGHYFIGSGNVIITFQSIRTSNGSQTIVEEGGARPNNLAGNNNVAVPINNCGTFNIPSAGKHTIRLMYEQTTATTVTNNEILADGSVSVGQRDIKITARYIDQQMPAPLIRQTVVSQSNGITNVEYANFHGASLNAVCSSTPCNTTGASGGITSIARSSTGNYQVNFAAGTFSAVPSCAFTVFNGSTNTITFAQAGSTSTQYRLQISVTSGGTSDVWGSVVCMGPR